MNRSNKIYTRILMAIDMVIILGVSVGLTQYVALWGRSFYIICDRN
ncbi:hypothetical protein [uncultured Anaerococcus sp.]|nr:hypothetical protein [uncultured Anaerococcus sp.]